MKKLLELFSALGLVLSIALPAMAEDDLITLRRQLAEQRAQNQAQQQQLEQQAKAIDLLSQRLDLLTAGKAEPGQTAADTAQSAPVEGKQGSGHPEMEFQRDIVGDLNSAGVKAGDFPGAFKIPGTKNVSLAIGGFVKTAAIADSNAEAMGADFLPATLGTRRSDTDGAFSVDASLTKLFLDGRAPAGDGLLRAYIEGDLNKTNSGSLDVNMRHAYGSWKNSYGTLLAGHTWSTMMDLKILPESITEPTVSGVIFSRQPQIRWSQPLASGFTLHASIEDPSSSDIFDSTNTPELSNTKFPDGVLGLEYDKKGLGHLRLNGILRDLEVDLPGGDDNALAWGVALSGHVELLERDRWVFSGLYGEGLGRYLLGIQSTAGSIIDPLANELVLRDNWGVMTAYQHHWTNVLRSNAMFGYAKSKPLGWQDDSAFKSSTYVATNLMWQVLPYLTLGIEYSYGQKENNDGSDLDNHRVVVGFQFY